MTKIHRHELEQILITTATSSSGESNSSDTGRGFVVLIKKDDNTRTRMICNLISAKQFFLIRLEILYV